MPHLSDFPGDTPRRSRHQHKFSLGPLMYSRHSSTFLRGTPWTSSIFCNQVIADESNLLIGIFTNKMTTALRRSEPKVLSSKTLRAPIHAPTTSWGPIPQR